MSFVEKAGDWLERVRIAEYEAIIERVFVIHVEAYDWNCPQHITPRHTAEEVREGMQAVEKRSDSGVEQQINTFPGEGWSRGCGAYRSVPSIIPDSQV